MKDKILRRLVIKPFAINQVKFADNFAIKGDVLEIDQNKIVELKESNDLITDLSIEIIEPGDYDRDINTIMDIIPISTKVLGTIGEGITHTLTGVYAMLTGCDEDGRQMHEFGSSEGILKDQMKFGRRGTPSENDYIIHIDVRIKGGLPYDRTLPDACFKCADDFVQGIRARLKVIDGRLAYDSKEYFDRIREGKKKVAIVKQVAGQGAMYDNLLFAKEPSGFEGGTSIDRKSVV